MNNASSLHVIVAKTSALYAKQPRPIVIALSSDGDYFPIDVGLV